jgi:hypothetical protein
LSERAHWIPHETSAYKYRLYVRLVLHSQIQGQLGDVTLYQIAYAVQHPVTLKKGSGRPSTLTPEEDLHERGVHYVKWLSFSPDLNPIEKVWNWMKDWIQDHFDDTLTSWDELREAMEAAWEALPATYLAEELSKMPARCQAVIDADGMHTRY